MGRLFDVPDEPPPGPQAADDAPLAARMRPRTLEEFVGQGHLLGPASALRTAIQSGEPHSMILYGPPGTGKTTLARMLAEYADAAFEELSAVQVGRAEVREVIARATERRRSGRHTIFFLDEIHRFNKAQQDALLPADVSGLIRRALEVEGTSLSDEVVEFLATRSGGDARTALNALELALATSARTGEPVTLADAEDAMQRKAVRYDKAGDQHYDYISAWIKSTRGSDPDASLYYLAAMIEGGEDARFIARRMVVLASEDVGNADPQALSVAVAAAYAVEHVGMPECTFALAQAAIYLSLAPKSNAAGHALGAARAHIREHGAQIPPAALRSAAYPGAQSLGRGRGYDYPHDHPGHVNDQEHLPEGLEDLRFYDPGDTEPTMRERLAAARDARRRDA
jgi:putative ATPase